MSRATICIGVSGHQNLSEETRVFVTYHFRDIITTYQQQGHDIVLYSSFALGADQLFVQIALEAGVPVEIVVPCTHYEDLFSSDDSKEAYTSLLRVSCAIHQLSSHECSDDAYLQAGQWIVEHCDLLIVAWNGLPPKGRGGTGDIANYAWLVHRPLIHLNMRRQSVKRYGETPFSKHLSAISPKRDFVLGKQTVYQGKTLTVNQYRLQMPDGSEILRDIVERPESVLVLPLGESDIILMVEEYDLGAGVWQLKLPGGKVENDGDNDVSQQAHKELRQEIGYRAGRLEKLLDFYSHPGYVAHKVHLFIAHDLEWDPLTADVHEEIRVRTFTLEEVLAETRLDYRCDPEAALALWLYAERVRH